jgi:signal transduction histidine kinase/DNA-binding response OmpR family regulator
LWQSSWAYGLYIIMFLVVIYGFRRYDLKRQRLKAQLELEHKHAQQCEELEHLKSRFFANISHEFRTPLTLIMGPLKQWSAKIRDCGLQQDLKLIQRNAERLLQLINQLLDLSKLEAGKLNLQVRLTNLTDFLKPLVLSFASLAERKRITLKFKLPIETILAYIDREMVEKILTNLLSNAFKFTLEGGTIEVKIYNPPVSPLIHKGGIKGGSGEFIQIHISDTGPGIPPEKLPHIFDRFYHSDDSQNHNPEGTGIGLALTKELVELHHGEISVESVEGKGSTFVVILPMGKEQFQVNEIREEGKPETGNRKSETTEESAETDVSTANCQLQTTEKETGDEGPETGKARQQPLLLIVEDHPDMRQYMRGYLANRYQILEAGDGKEGIDLALEKSPDLIISDVMMPEIDGFGLVQKLKTDERTSHIPIILLTARADAESKLEGLETGADDYLTKPFDARELQVRVHNLIEQRRKLRERFSQQTAIQPREITVTSMDEQFLQRAMDILEQHISDARFSIEDFSYEIGFSQRHLNRKLQALTNLPARDFIRTLRLQRARQLLQKKSATIMEIAYEVGFNNPSHFSKCFKKQFGQSPSEFVGGRG